MKKKLMIIIGVLAVGALSAGAYFFIDNENKKNDQNILHLYGNIDIRQVNLPFQISERIDKILVDEGDRVTPGMPLAQLETIRLQQAIDQAEAAVQANEFVLLKLKNGPRPEEIDQGKAKVEAMASLADYTKKRAARFSELFSRQAESQQNKEDSEAAYDVAKANLKVAEKELAVLLAGTRKEEIAQQEALLQESKVRLEILKQNLKDATLAAPVHSVVRKRLMEPGEMASPQTPVLLLAVTSPKWVRCYVREADLGKVKYGMEAEVFSDSYPNQPFKASVGYISDVAEFTPKTVETPELRTALVYEVRVLVEDPESALHLGAPVEVKIKL